MRRLSELIRYHHDLGWHDPPDLPDAEAPPAGRSGASAPATCASLDELAATADGCTRCRLAVRRRHVVFGDGSHDAALLFVGEGPGADEDRIGRPFVGQAGKLLDAMIAAIGLERSEVYIANVVKCRPPGNRDPQSDEMEACSPLLARQIELVRPRVVVALGRVAARWLTGADRPLSALRGRWHAHRGIDCYATYHPAYLLRTPIAKRAVWDDLKAIARRLGETAG